MKLPDTMHAGYERSVRRGRGLAVNAAPVIITNDGWSVHETVHCHVANVSTTRMKQRIPNV